MSRLLEDLDRALGTVGLGQTCLALFARRHGAVAEQPAVALVVLAEQVRDEVVAAAVPLAALGADLHLHRVGPVCAVCRSGPARPATDGAARMSPAAMSSSWALGLPHAKPGPAAGACRCPVPPPR